MTGTEWQNPMNFSPPGQPGDWQRLQYRRLFARQITRTGNLLGCALLLSQLAGMVVSLFVPALIGLVLPAADGVVYDALEYAFYSPLSMGLVFWLVAVAGRQRLQNLLPFGAIRPLEALGCILVAFWGVAAGNWAAGWVEMLFPATAENLESVMGAAPATPLELVLNLLYIAALPALIEEFCFRGVALGLLRSYGDRFAILVSAALFALLHGKFIQIPFAFALGLVLAYATVRTGSIWPAVITHFCNNAMSVLLDYFEPGLTALFGDAFGLLLYALWLLLGCVGFLILHFCCRRPAAEIYRPYLGCLAPAGRNGAFWKAPAIIASLVLYLGMALVFLAPLHV